MRKARAARLTRGEAGATYLRTFVSFLALIWRGETRQKGRKSVKAGKGDRELASRGQAKSGGVRRTLVEM
jgi:hypothetical protein